MAVDDGSLTAKGPVGRSPLLPDYGGACIANVVPACSSRPTSCPPGCPRRSRRPTRSCCSCSTASGWEQLQARGRPRARPWRPWPAGPSPRSRPSTTATALTSIATGLPPGEHGVVGYRIDVDGEVLNVLRWRRRRGDARQRDPAGEVPAASSRSSATVRRSSPGPSSAIGLHRAPTSTGVRFRLPGAVDAGGRDRRGCSAPASRSSTLLRGHRQGRPRVRPRRPLRRRAAPPSTAWSADLIASLPPGAALRRHRRPRPGRRRRPHRRARTPRCSPTSSLPVGRGPVPLAARPARAGRRAARGRHAATTPTRRGCARREQVIDEGWFGPEGHRRGRPGSATWRSSARDAGRVPRSRRHRARTSWSAATARSRRPRCWCRCSAAAA